MLPPHFSDDPIPRKISQYSWWWPTPSWSLYKTSCHHHCRRWAANKRGPFWMTNNSCNHFPHHTQDSSLMIPTARKILKNLQNICGGCQRLPDHCTKCYVVITASIEWQNQKWSPKQEQFMNISGTRPAIGMGSMIAWSMGDGTPWRADFQKRKIPMFLGKNFKIFMEMANTYLMTMHTVGW